MINMPHFAISSIGKDQPGIVGAFTKVLYEFECNIEDASMTILCDQFAMILVISTPDAFNINNFKNSLDKVEKEMGLHTSIKPIEEKYINGAVNNESKAYMISVSGSDRTGIAYHITEILARYDINITDFNSKLISKKAKPVYIMMIETRIPLDIDIKQLEDELTQKANELDVEMKLKEIELCEF
jgi:glycine cleavage system transcriptional repressor